jgi:hypothetical protein
MLLSDYVTQMSTALADLKPFTLLSANCAQSSPQYAALLKSQHATLDRQRQRAAEAIRLFSPRMTAEEEMMDLWSFSPEDATSGVSTGDSFGIRGRVSAADHLIVADEANQLRFRQNVAQEINAGGLLAFQSEYEIRIGGIGVGSELAVHSSAALYNGRGTVAWRMATPATARRKVDMSWWRITWIGLHKTVAFINLTQSERKYVLDRIATSAKDLHREAATAVAAELAADLQNR